MADSTSYATINGTIIYHYEPSLALASAFCVGFAIVTGLHTYQMLMARSWYMIPIVIGSTCEAIGYLGRILGSTSFPNVSLAPYIIQAILLLIAPALIAASVYMIMGYVLRATDGDRYSLIREGLVTKLFVIGDIFSFLIQSTGAGLLTKDEQKSKDAGNWIIIGGLAVQIIFFGFFMVVTAMFCFRLGADKPKVSQLRHACIPWRSQTSLLLVASILIMIRSVFRVIEYVQGQDGYLLSHELYLYIFDAALMFATVVLFNLFHPTRITNLVTGGKTIRNIVLVDIAGATSKSARAHDPEYSPVTFSERTQHQ